MHQARMSVLTTARTDTGSSEVCAKIFVKSENNQNIFAFAPECGDTITPVQGQTLRRRRKYIDKYHLGRLPVMKCMRIGMAVAIGFLLSQCSVAHQAVYFIVLDGPSESPPVASPATGTGTVTVDLDLFTMRI